LAARGPGFGSRAGLLQALLEEKSRQLRDTIKNGPPSLGAGAPVRERLLAFLDGLGAIAEGNPVLLSAHDQACAEDKYDDPSYQGLAPPPQRAVHASTPRPRRRWPRHCSAMMTSSPGSCRPIPERDQ
jgi:hypothetical protein